MSEEDSGEFYEGVGEDVWQDARERILKEHGLWEDIEDEEDRGDNE